MWGCKCTRAIFIRSDSAFIFITAINMATWIFQQFLQTHYVLFQWSIRHSVNMETEECYWGLFGGAEAWIIGLSTVGGECPLLKYFWARHCNEVPEAAVYRKLLCVCALCKAFQCMCLSKATAGTCLVKQAAENKGCREMWRSWFQTCSQDAFQLLVRSDKHENM